MIQLEIEPALNPNETRLQPSYRMDLRNFTEKEYNKFVKLNTVNDWSQLSWKGVGRPYEVTSFAQEKKSWEEVNQQSLPANISWQMFNKSFHEWFVKDVPAEMDKSKQNFMKSLTNF
ncbi:hypothetical protein [Mesobacillus selenatarsenatis]|nr:hypothetical protein [Mesobacillus selenatarsenatis]